MQTRPHNDDSNELGLLSRRQLAIRWQVSKETIKRREKAGVLPVLKLGRSSVDSFVFLLMLGLSALLMCRRHLVCNRRELSVSSP